MRRTPAQPERSSPPPLPFDAPAARRLRAALGMGPGQVAHGLRTSFGLPHLTADHVLAWEDGTVTPGPRELTALAGVLWCSPSELTGRPRTLRQHRTAQGLAAEDVAVAVGLEPLAYVRMEEDDEWRGTERQSAVLADLLRLSLPDFVTVTGQEPKLSGLLCGAVTTRWQGYVRPVGRMVPLRRRLIERTLRELHEEYRDRRDGTPAAPVPPGPVTVPYPDPGPDFLGRIVEHFWTKVGALTA